MNSQSADRIGFRPKDKLFGTIRPPGSKSITNRALICAAMGRGECLLDGVLFSEDTEVMIHAWQQLGVKIAADSESKTCHVLGCGGKLPTKTAKIFVANSGTSIRFLTAALAACHGEFALDGIPRMRERPIGDLIDALKQLGVEIFSSNDDHRDCPPLQIKATGLRGGAVKIAGNISSQYLSGLMMAAPYADAPVNIEIVGELVSRPYVAITQAVMAAFGVAIEPNQTGYDISAPVAYSAKRYSIEPDASAASYYLAAAAMTGGEVTIQGLGRDSLQGDVRFAEVLGKMGCDVQVYTNSIALRGNALRGIDIDMNAISDTVQTLAAVALFAKGPTRIRGVAHNRFKETDRIGDLACELRRAGAEVTEHEDGLTIIPKALRQTTFETYNDHRMAMSLSLIGLRQPDIYVSNPSCTAKTYPEYFQDMSGCFNLELV